MTGWRFTRLAPLAAVCAAGCFATRNDVRLVQANVASVQASVAQLTAAQQAEVRRQVAQAAQADSARARELRQMLATLKVLTDSVVVLSDRASRDRANTAQSFRELDEKLSGFMQILAANSKATRDALADMEARRATAAATTSGADSASAQGGVPSSRALYQLGREQYGKQSYGSAREALELLLKTYPNAPEASGALLLIGQTFTTEGKDGDADSVYASVVKRFPKSREAPSALFKRAEALAKNGQPTKARGLYLLITTDYKDSDEVELARDRLKRLPLE